MDNWHKILGGGLILTLIYIIFMQGCGVGSKTITETITDTVHVETLRVDTIKVPVEKLVTKTIRVKIPVPYIDTTSDLTTPRELTIDDFDDLISERPMIYTDTVSDDTVAIHYRIRTWGFIDKMSIGYTLKNQYYIKERETIQITITEIKQPLGFYIGLDVAANADGLTHFAPMVQLTTPKMTYNGGYDLNDKSFVLGLRRRILFRKD